MRSRGDRAEKEESEMTFTDFGSNAGHRQMSREIIAELAALGARMGVSFASEGGRLGSGELMIKLVVKTSDRATVEQDAKRDFAREARYMGLEADDYGAMFRSPRGGLFKLVGVSP